MQLKDVKVIVTGAARGMGAHFARRLAEAGAQVAAGDVDDAALSELPPGVHKRKLDVRREGEVAEFVAWAREAMGGMNALVNNAGHHPRRPAREEGPRDRRDQDDDRRGLARRPRREPHRRDVHGARGGGPHAGRAESRPGVVVNMS